MKRIKFNYNKYLQSSTKRILINWCHDPIINAIMAKLPANILDTL